MELNNEYNEFHEEYNSQMAFPPRTTHGDVNGLQPLHTQLTKPEASLSRKMLCSGSQEFFFLGFTVHGWHSSDQ